MYTQINLRLYHLLAGCYADIAMHPACALHRLAYGSCIGPGVVAGGVVARCIAYASGDFLFFSGHPAPGVVSLGAVRGGAAV